MAVLALSAGLAYGGRAIWLSGPLHLRTVEVAGNAKGRVTPGQVAAAAGLKIGVNLFQVSTTEAAKRLTRLPWVARAEVERILPSKVRVTVKERRPFLVLVVGGRSYLSDADGVVIAEADAPLVRVFDLPLSALRAGDRIELRPFTEATSVIKGLTPRLRSALRSIRAPSVAGIVLELEGGVSVIYGSAEKSEDKNYAAELLMDRYQAQKKAVASIDVRVPLRPTVRLG